MLTNLLDLTKPTFFDGKLITKQSDLKRDNTLKLEPLLTTHEFENFKYYNLRERKHIWDNTLSQIKNADFSYRGQR